MNQTLRLIISCGGTGGHFYPGLAVARTLQEEGGGVRLLLGGKNALKQKETAKSFGIESVLVSAAPLSKNPYKLLLAGWAQFKGFLQARKAVRTFKPDAVLSMGSFTSLPAALGAHFENIPLFLHDGNARIGKANRKLSRFVKILMTAFPAVNAKACRCPCQSAGMPLRPELITSAQKLTKTSAIAALNEHFNTSFNSEMPTVLIFGGSLGARTINTVFPAACAHIKSPFQVIHLTGPGHLREKMYTQKALTLEGTPHMDICYAAADLVISRAGGSTLAELALFGKGAVVIPYPHASEDHQNDNARAFAQAGAVKIIQDHEVSGTVAEEILRDWLQHPETVQERNAKMAALGCPEASKTVLRTIVQEVFSHD